jgi:hypothetical protein
VQQDPNEPSSRSERRAQPQRRSHAGLVIGGAILAFVAVIVVVAVVAFAGGDDDAGDDGGDASRPVANTNVRLELGEVTADSAGAPVTVSPEVADGVVGVIGRYLEVATVEPLRTAAPAGDLSGIFDAAALARVNGADRAALVDEGAPEVTGDLDVVAQPVAVTGLGDQDGKLMLVTATIDLDVTGATAAKGPPLHILRTGYFVLAPDPAGVWRVSAYSITVGREGGGIDATTTTVGGGQ